MNVLKRMREAAAGSAAGALERGDLAQFKGTDDPDDGEVQEMTEDDGDQVTCPTCKGSGKIRGGSVKCPNCDGSGKVPAGTSSSKESAQLVERVAELERLIRSAESIREARPDHLNQEFGPMVRVRNSHGDQGYEVTLIREGLGNQSDGAWYPGSAIKEVCESGRAEGMQAFSDHPTLEEEEQRPERSVRELIGTHTDVRYVEENGIPKAKAIFVPITTDDQDPFYGWVNTLAEAAAKSRGPQPLVGWSLFGLSAGDEGKRPDGSEGRIVSLIIPSSGDMVTNAGAGGEFARKLMMESARRLRRVTTHNKEDEPMLIGQFQTQMAEALKELREAATPEATATAMKKVEALQAEASKIEAASPPPESIEALTESAPQLVTALRESAKREASEDSEGIKTQLREAQEQLGRAERLLSGITNVTRLAEAVRGAGVEDDVEIRHFIGLAQQRGLTESEDIKAMVEAEKAYDKRREDSMLTAVREAIGQEFPEVEGFLQRSPEQGEDTGGGFVDALRETGVPIREEQAA